MPAKKPTPDPSNLRVCGGTCGRMTRSSRYTVKDFPGTISRQTASLCTSCYVAERNAAKTPEELAAEKAEKLAKKQEGYDAAEKAHAQFLADRRRRQTERLARQARLTGHLGQRAVYA